jgi:hypothetical protein
VIEGKLQLARCYKMAGSRIGSCDGSELATVNRTFAFFVLPSFPASFLLPAVFSIGPLHGIIQQLPHPLSG